jgi:hypothetical protein
MKKNIIITILTCIIIIPSQILNMESTSEFLTSSPKNIFDQFIFNHPLQSLLAISCSGRAHLVQCRAAEICRDITYTRLLTNRRAVSPSLFVDEIFDATIYCSTRPIEFDQFSPLQTLVAATAGIEDCLLTCGRTLASNSVQKLETTRKQDLFLIDSILRQDKVDGAYSLPAIVKATDAEWPPKQCSAQVHPTSSHTVIINALTLRKANNIDEQPDFIENLKLTVTREAIDEQ